MYEVFGRIPAKKGTMKNKTIRDYMISEERLFVIGNGPSFAQSLDKYKDRIAAGPCMVVNTFPMSDQFEIIKPKYYTAVDPGMFREKDKAFSRTHDVIKAFRDRTDWDVTVFIPDCFYDSYFIREIRKNDKIHVVTFCDRIRTGWFFSKDNIRMFLQDKNLLIPPSQTVLNLALWLGVFFETKEIYLMGADTSYMEEIRVDQENNDIIVNDNHFNDSFSYRESDNCGRSLLAAQLEDLARALREYEYIGRYARKKGCVIYNASEYSYIDVFERRKPD